MEEIKVTIDITKATDNAYLRQLQYKTHSQHVQNILKINNPPTAVDKKIMELATVKY